jgi:hypothetical protein
MFTSQLTATTQGARFSSLQSTHGDLKSTQQTQKLEHIDNVIKNTWADNLTGLKKTTIRLDNLNELESTIRSGAEIKAHHWAFLEYKEAEIQKLWQEFLADFPKIEKVWNSYQEERWESFLNDSPKIREAWNMYQKKYANKLWPSFLSATADLGVRTSWAKYQRDSKEARLDDNALREQFLISKEVSSTNVPTLWKNYLEKPMGTGDSRNTNNRNLREKFVNKREIHEAWKTYLGDSKDPLDNKILREQFLTSKSLTFVSKESIDLTNLNIHTNWTEFLEVPNIAARFHELLLQEQNNCNLRKQKYEYDITKAQAEFIKAQAELIKAQEKRKKQIEEELNIVNQMFLFLQEAYIKTPKQLDGNAVNPLYQDIDTRYQKILGKKEYLETYLRLEEKRYTTCLEHMEKTLELEKIKDASEELVGSAQREIESLQSELLAVESEIREIETSHMELTRHVVPPSLGKRIVRKICAPVSWAWKKIKIGFLLDWQEQRIIRSIKKHHLAKCKTANFETQKELQRKIDRLHVDLALVKLESLELRRH